MHYSPETRSALERKWADESAAEDLDDTGYALWKSHKHAQRQMVGRNKILIHYRTGEDSPEILRVWKLVDTDLDLSAGVFVTLEATDDKQEFTFTHSPRLLPGSKVFVWAAYFPDVQHVRLSGEKFSDWLAIAVKFATRADRKTPGAEHLLDVKSFKALYPQHADTTF